MEPAIHCPKCGELIEPAVDDKPPLYCPSCGVRVSCPKCGAMLQRSFVHSDSFSCPACGTIPELPATVPGGTPTVVLRNQAGVPAAEQQIRLPGFDILDEIGHGGMGVVYRARQLSLNRDVALKVLLPEFSGDAHLLGRFLNEAEIMGKLTESHILPVFDVLHAHERPVIVMPHVEGPDLGACDLRRIIKERYTLQQGQSVDEPHPWATLSDRDYLTRVLRVLDQLIDAVAAMHAANVLHRDIKPSNALVDRRGNIWLSDFGLSRLGERRLHTRRGAPIGTYGFMSPEQSAGEIEIDARSDLFGLGVTLYQALTLELPYGTRGARPADPLPAAPSRRQRLLSRDLDAVVLKAIEPERNDRYATTAELQDDWRLARQGLLPRARRLGPFGRLARRARRNPAGIAAAVMFCAIVGLLVYVASRPAPAAIVDPNRTVIVTTVPSGARVVFVPIDEEPWDVTDGEPLPEQAIRPAAGQTPLVLEHVPPGTYLVVADLPDYGFHEVYRTVPRRGTDPVGSSAHRFWTTRDDGALELPEIKLFKSRPQDPVLRGMIKFDGGRFTMGPSQNLQANPAHERSIGSFYLDRTEVTFGEYRREMKFLPPQFRGLQTPPPDDYPVSYVTYDEAVAYAEKVGKRLPAEDEYEYAATVGGKQRFPWGDDAERITGWSMGPVGEPQWDRTPGADPVLGLYANVAEWTTSMLGPYPGATLTPGGVPEEWWPPALRSPMPPIPEAIKAEWRDGRVVRGGPWSVVVGFRAPAEWPFGPRMRHSVSKTERHPGLGLRCARSDRPRLPN